MSYLLRLDTVSHHLIKESKQTYGHTVGACFVEAPYRKKGTITFMSMEHRRRTSIGGKVILPLQGPV